MSAILTILQTAHDTHHAQLMYNDPLQLFEHPYHPRRQDLLHQRSDTLDQGIMYTKFVS